MSSKLYKCPAYLFIAYHMLKKSRSEIGEECSISNTTILTYMKKYNIPRRDISEALKGRIISEEWKKKISESKRGENNPIFGKHLSKETKRKLSKVLSNEKNPSWKGKEAGYKAIHLWIQKNKPKSEVCEICGEANTYLELANISGDYKREIYDFMWLCKPCHINFDKKQGRWGQSLKKFSEVEY